MGQMVMSETERARKAYMEMVRLGQMKLNKAADALDISYRQAKRIYKAYKTHGDIALVHKLRGQPSNRCHPDKDAIIKRYLQRYTGFGPTLAAEKLEEDDGLYVDHETLRRWLLQANMWKRQRKRSPHRQWREPKAQFGEMVQIDGSFHDWFQTKNGQKDCLLDFVDDATSITMARLEPGETTAGLFRLMWAWIEKYGIPMSIYVDLKNVYVTQKQNTLSHFEKACQKLGIRIIKAYSAQAKGRVERKHGVYQDRLVKEMGLYEIDNNEKANTFLQERFLDKLNTKFAKPPRDPQSAHRLCDVDLNQILCWEYKRQIQNDWTISFGKQCYQIKKIYGVAIKPKSNITIRKHLDDSVSAWHKEQALPMKKLDTKPETQSAAPKIKKGYSSTVCSQSGKKGKLNSPWRQINFTKRSKAPKKVVYTSIKHFIN